MLAGVTFFAETRRAEDAERRRGEGWAPHVAQGAEHLVAAGRFHNGRAALGASLWKQDGADGGGGTTGGRRGVGDRVNQAGKSHSPNAAILMPGNPQLNRRCGMCAIGENWKLLATALHDCKRLFPAAHECCGGWWCGS